MNRILGIVLLLLSLTPAVGIGGVQLADQEIIKAVEHAHLQLDRWATRLMYRIERGAGPRQSDPLLDGRAHLMVTKMRANYAAAAGSRKLAVAIHHLADAHEDRLRSLDAMLRRGVVRQPLRPDDESIASAFRELSALRD
ncbi:MAG: hypothetical protein KJO54_06080 [Gammaproteobacteria bacterium]|nr:hypothetical protein [Gammaproteobacteria bacterium]NNF61253.1 hypothetical protein [Gammaproteobacteria bacterium]